MIKQFMKMGGVKTEEEFYAKYPTEESFFEAFPQAQNYVKQMGGPQAQAQDPLTQVIMAVAQQLQIDPKQLAQMLQQNPKVVSQLEQMANQDPQQAAQALMQLIQNSAGQGQAAEQSAPAQAGEMPMDPEQAMQMAYGGSKLNRFIRKEGGDIAFPQAAPMYDDSVYRTFPPNFPRLFQDGGGISKFQGTQDGSETGQQAGVLPEWMMPSKTAVISGIGAGGLGYIGRGLNKKVSEAASKSLEKPKEKWSSKDLTEVSNYTNKLTDQYIKRTGNVKLTPKEKTAITADAEELFRISREIKAKNPKYNKADVDRLIYLKKLYPDTPVNQLANEWMSKSRLERSKEVAKEKTGKFGEKFFEMGPVGLGALGLGLGWGIPALYHYFTDEPTQGAIDESIPEQSPGGYFINSSGEPKPDIGTMMNIIQQNATPLDNYTNGITTTTDATSHKFGGDIYEYGGGTPYGYGYFAPPMAYGGDASMPGIYDTESQRDMNNNYFMNYVKQNIDNSAYTPKMRRGGSPLKKKVY